MIKGKTKTGFKFEIDERVLEDWNLLKAIGHAESEDPSERIRGVMSLAELLLGDKEDALKKHIADRNDGFVPTAEMSEAITDILLQAKELKNSQSSEG